MPETNFYRKSNDAFDDAIASGNLKTDSTSPLYAGKFMYMHSSGKFDHFKNIATRKYLTFERR